MHLFRVLNLGSGSRWRGALAVMILVCLWGVLGYMLIICGYGRMGAIIADTLCGENIPVVVIEQDPMRRPETLPKGLTYLTGDATKDRMEYHPSAETVIHADDTLIALGKPEGLAKVRRHLD